MNEKEQRQAEQLGVWWGVSGLLASGIAAANYIVENHEYTLANGGLGALAIASYGVAIYHFDKLPPTGSDSRDEL